MPLIETSLRVNHGDTNQLFLARMAHQRRVKKLTDAAIFSFIRNYISARL
jgi:hypothetical protein